MKISKTGALAIVVSFYKLPDTNKKEAIIARFLTDETTSQVFFNEASEYLTKYMMLTESVEVASGLVHLIDAKFLVTGAAREIH